jgi:hypothetical protein
VFTLQLEAKLFHIMSCFHINKIYKITILMYCLLRLVIFESIRRAMHSASILSCIMHFGPTKNDHVETN